MGFLDFMSKMAKGEPVFEDKGTQSAQAPTPPTDDEDQAVKKGDESTFPVARITQVTPRETGDRLQVYCYIENTWANPIKLDKIDIFGAKRELDTVLSAGQGREFLVYDGPLLQSEPTEVKLQYKTHPGGDYFEAEHEAKFVYNAQNATYKVSDIQLHEPIRDIFG